MNVCEDVAFTTKYKSSNAKKVSKVANTRTCDLCGGHGYIKQKCEFLCRDEIDGDAHVIQQHGTQTRI